MESNNKHVPLKHRSEVSRIERFILDLWKNDPAQELNATAIIAEMEKFSISKNKTLRYLSRLVAHYNIDKRSDNQQMLYKLRLRPKEFNQLGYVANLDRAVSSKNMKYEWGVGGSLSQLAAGTILGFPHVEKDSDPDVAFVLDILLTTTAKMFDSLDDLRDVILLRKAGVKIKIPNGVLRTLILQT